MIVFPFSQQLRLHHSDGATCLPGLRPTAHTGDLEAAVPWATPATRTLLW
jgi:hypothetical protein